MSELNFKISAESKSATKVIAKARQFEIIIDEPQDLGGKDEAPDPVRDHGVYVPCFEDSTHPCGGRLWAMGSTYERGQTDTTVTAAGHDRNAASLASTLPNAHALFETQRAAGELQGWAQVRCASLDRLPLMGAVPDAAALQHVMAAAGARRGRVPLSAVPRWAWWGCR